MTEQIISAKQNQNTKEALTRALSILIIRRENRAIVLKPEKNYRFCNFWPFNGFYVNGFLYNGYKSVRRLHRRDVTHFK